MVGAVRGDDGELVVEDESHRRDCAGGYFLIAESSNAAVGATLSGTGFDRKPSHYDGGGGRQGRAWSITKR